MTRAQRLLFVAILMVAAALRLWGLTLSLPNVDGRPDEWEMLVHTAGFPQGNLDPDWFIYPTLFLYVFWLWIEGVLGIRRLWTATPPYADALQVALPTMLLAGRLLSALVGIATVAMVYRVAARGEGPRRGLVAAALLATGYLHVRDSHFLKTEALLAAGVLIAVALLARWAETDRRTHALAAGAAIGATTGIKYPAACLLVSAWVADRLRARGDGSSAWPSRDLLWLAFMATAIFVAGSPYLVTNFQRMWDWIVFIGVAMYAQRPERLVPSSSAVEGFAGWLAGRSFDYHLLHSLRYGYGLVQSLALPAALLWALRRREPLLVIAASFCVVWYLVNGLSPVRLSRYLTPLMPLVAILLADLVVAISARARTAHGRTVVACALTAGLAAEPLWSSIQADRIAAREDTRVMATAWMARELPRDARVTVLGTVLLPQGAPPVPAGIKIVPPPDTAQALAAAGVTHVVTHDHPLMFSRVDPALLATLAPSLRLVAEFSPFAGEARGGFEAEDAYYIPFFAFAGVLRPGPHVRIYETRPPAS